MKKIELGKLIRDKREAHNMSREKLGEYLGVSSTAVQNWEGGQDKPTFNHGRKLSQLLNIDIALLTDIDPLSTGALIMQKRISANLSLSKLGQKVGVSGTTIQQWERGKLKIKKYEHAKTLSEILNINIAQLLDDPSYNVLPESDIPTTSHHIQEGGVDYRVVKNQPDAAEFRISDALAMAARVLESGTSYAVALFLNIQQFASALETGKELKAYRDEVRDLKSRVDELQKQVDRLTAVPTTTEESAAGSGKAAM